MKRLIILTITLIIVCSFIPAQAKPKPPDPYPLPVPDLGTQAYPAPGEGLPGVTDPVFTGDDPRPWIPYVWGIYMSSNGNFKVFVTIQTGWPVFDMEGGACIMSTASYAVTCYDLNARYYNGETGTMTYTSDDIRLCGRFVVQAAALDGIPADIQEPNLYALRCVFLPWLRRFWY